MMERHDHINPWADKLQDIRLPGEEVSWRAMEAVLDRDMPVNKMPVNKWGDRRRWLLVIILLLLLTGVCNCPGRRLAGDREKAGGMKEAPKMAGGADKPVGGTDKPVGGEGKVTNDTINTTNERSVKDNTESGSDGGAKPERELARHTVGKEKSKTSGESGGGTGGTGTVSGAGTKGKVGGSGRVSGPGPVSSPGADQAGGHGNVAGHGGKPATKDTAANKGKTPMATQAPKSKTAQHADSTAAAKKPTADSILQMKGWLAGVGLNQFFTVGGQQKSNYNSNGTTGGVSDYIPVPMVRYYFSRKLYVQLEAQFNTPQYTTKNLLASQSKPDSFSVPGHVVQTSLYIKKLFYFNMPLSIHYSPIPNLYIGGGIQYARLTNGVALYQDSGHNIFSGGSDSLRSSKLMSFKNDTTYSKLKTNEFRLMLDLNYNFKRFVIGGRYNRGLSNFINLQISSTQVTQSRNSSFQVYLRYFIWDGRKKTLLPK